MEVRIIGQSEDTRARIRRFAGEYCAGRDRGENSICLVLPGGVPEGSVACGAALIPGELAGVWAERMTTPCAVTYGAGGKETLTYSSRIGPWVMASLQREVRTPWGVVAESQEFCVPGGGGDMSLALGGLLLLLGERPEKIGEVLHRSVIFELPGE